MKKRMWYQGQERQLQDLFGDFNWHEIDGKDSTTLSPDLTSAVRDKQNFTDKDLKLSGTQSATSFI